MMSPMIAAKIYSAVQSQADLGRDARRAQAGQ